MDANGTHGAIDGVVVHPLHQVVNERGHLLELARADDDWFVPFGQLYTTLTHPGVVKAWYRHRSQDDSLTVVAGSARLALYDDRPGSPTEGCCQVEDIDADTRRCVVVPRLVWHGFQTTGNEPALLVHVNSVAIRLDDPDEERRDPTDPSMPAVWHS